MFNQFALEAVHTHKKLYPLIIGGLLNTHSDFCVCDRDTCQHTTRGVPLWRLTCVHANRFLESMGSRLGAYAQIMGGKGGGAIAPTR